jgi:hypothetical protein
MSVVEALWADVLRVVATGTFWTMVVAAFLVGMLLARLLIVPRIRRDEEPVAAARAMWTLSALLTFVVFAAVAYALDAWSAGTLVAGGAFVLLPADGSGGRVGAAGGRREWRMTEQRVYKTLVIGLGSTGARVVDRLASAVAWELGGGDKAPWLEYLCLETDANELAKLPHVRPEDFRVLGVDKTEFALMVANPSQFDPTNGLSSWIDLPTVRKLPDGAVQSGVGNIRMVGRLAFLHKANFEVVKQMVARRLDRLRALTANAATDARGKLQGGANPPVTFASPHVQVYVVGTLCGGTASGVAGDMGFFVRSLLHDGETVTAMYTVPRPDLTAALHPLAERFKKNAYHALVELNHYHLPERSDEAPVRFPDGTQSRVGDFPYDLTFV